MKLFKRFAAAALAAVMAASFAACSGKDTSWAAKNGETVVPVGAYIADMMQKYSYQTALFGSEDVLKETMGEGEDKITVAQSIQNESKENTARALAILAKAEELGLSLTEEEKASIKKSVDHTWDTNGELYEKNGVADTSIEFLTQVSMLSDKIFDATYGKGGSEEVPEQELKDLMDEKYMLAGMMVFQKPAKTPVKEDATEEEKAMAEETYNTSMQTVRFEAQDWLTRATSMKGQGKEFNEVMAEYEKEHAEDPSKVDVNANRYVLVAKDASDAPQEVVDALEKATIGEPQMVESEQYLVVFAKQDMHKDPMYFEQERDALLSELKGEDYEAMIKAYAESLTIEYNDAALSKYVPKKIKLK